MGISSSLQFINNSHNASSSSIRSILELHPQSSSSQHPPVSCSSTHFLNMCPQTARSTMLNIQDQHRPVKARELELDLPRAVAHQRKLRHSQEDQEARRQRK